MTDYNNPTITPVPTGNTITPSSAQTPEHGGRTYDQTPSERGVPDPTERPSPPIPGSSGLNH